MTIIFYPTVTPHEDILMLSGLFEGILNIFLPFLQQGKGKSK